MQIRIRVKLQKLWPAVFDTCTLTHTHSSRKRIYEKETKGRCTCVHVCVCLTCVKADPEYVSRSFQITLTSRKTQFDSFFSFLFYFFFFLSIIFLLFLLLVAWCNNEFQSGYILFVPRSKTVTYTGAFDEFKRNINVTNTNCSNRKQ